MEAPATPILRLKRLMEKRDPVGRRARRRAARKTSKLNWRARLKRRERAAGDVPAEWMFEDVYDEIAQAFGGASEITELVSTFSLSDSQENPEMLIG